MPAQNCGGGNFFCSFVHKFYNFVESRTFLVKLGKKSHIIVAIFANRF